MVRAAVEGSKLKEPQLILPTFSASDIKKLLAWRPKGFYETRLHVFVLLLMDTGCRNAEATGLKWPDVDLDNLLLKLHGKGGKDRLVRFSFELRRQLYRWKQLNRWVRVFSGQQGQRLGREHAPGRETAVRAVRHHSTGTDHSRFQTHIRGELFAEGWERVPPTEDARPFNP